jgi:hypothetical protein
MRSVFLLVVEISGIVVFTVDSILNPSSVISDSLYLYTPFCLFMSFYIWLHIGVLACTQKSLALISTAAVSALGWALVVLFDSRTGRTLHAVGVVVYIVFSIAYGIIATHSRWIDAFIAVETVLAAVYIVLALNGLQTAAPVQRVAFGGLLGLYVWFLRHVTPSDAI